MCIAKGSWLSDCGSWRILGVRLMKTSRRHINFGTICIAIGVVAIIISSAIWIYNDIEYRRVANNSRQKASDLLEIINNGDQYYFRSVMTGSSGAAATFMPHNPDVTSIDEHETHELILVDGVEYIGVISIPGLSLDLPVSSAWSYQALRNTPCRFSGSIEDNDLVIAAHNNRANFGNINTLQLGDPVIITDVTGAETHYYIVNMERAQPSHTAFASNGQYDLTFFTCTYEGRARFVFRANRVDFANGQQKVASAK